MFVNQQMTQSILEEIYQKAPQPQTKSGLPFESMHDSVDIQHCYVAELDIPVSDQVETQKLCPSDEEDKTYFVPIFFVDFLMSNQTNTYRT